VIDLFSDLVDEEKLHPNFKRLRDSHFFSPARATLQKVAEDFEDPDGNFVEQFQTRGFDSRTFELFLFAMFKESGHSIDRTQERPDFGLGKQGIEAWVEAVTANPMPGQNIVPYQSLPKFRSDEEVEQYHAHELAIRLGSPLFSKLEKEYWKLSHVAGKPFILAIQDFHEEGSLTNTSSSLAHYLFGIDGKWHHDEAGRLIIDNQPVEEHRSGSKAIPSGFFALPKAENVSAVLFCNTGTVSKFNRMGHQGQYHDPAVRMIRWGTCFRPDPNATLPEGFLYEVGAEQETWREGTVLIHNPGAINKVPSGWLGAAVEDQIENGQVVSTFREPFVPFSSLTLNFDSTVPEEVIHQEAARITAILEKFCGQLSTFE
jgi:hypothetical protein